MDISPTTTQDLTKLLQEAYGKRDVINTENFRYVIYARKSTDEKTKQVRSIEDQITECREFADRNKLRWVDVIEEAESAKEPDIRPKFRKMLADIQAKKYDGIIAWHPDRLARNMKDAGMIIDLVDKFIIKDMKFVSFTFQNDPSGKMLLGITFAISKEYSDKLSENVKRGNRSRTALGMYVGNKPKHGYFKDGQQFLRTDGHNFELIKNTFMMRLNEKKSQPELAKYLNDEGYCRAGWKKNKPYKMTTQKVQKYMRDPVYTGVLMYGKKDIVDLTALYDFVPMLSVEDFMKINRLTSQWELFRLARSYRRGEAVKANLMRQMIICDECGEVMTSGITPKKNKAKTKTTNYFYYRCETDDCSRYGKSVRAKYIMDYIYTYLRKKPFSSKQSYDHYVDEMKRVSLQRVLDAQARLLTLQAQKRQTNEKIDRTKDFLMSGESEKVKDFYRGDLEKAKVQSDALDVPIKEAEDYITNSKVSLLTYEKFLELMDNMAIKIASIKNMAELDFYIRKIFLNFTVKGKEVVKSTLNTPFDMLETYKISHCAR